MKRYTTLLFDLDGTLTDSGPGIINAVLYALHYFGIEEPNRESLHRFIGPPLVDSFQEFYGFSHRQALEATETFRVYYKEKGILENTPYPGIPELLADLKQAGYQVCMATSKPEVLAKRVAENFGLVPYFDFLVGATMDESRATKEAVLADLLERLPADKSEIVMIGDRKFDVNGAKAFGLDSIGVLYGYGSREELEAAGATYLVQTVGELRTLLLDTV